jgi:hypothetical protein
MTVVLHGLDLMAVHHSFHFERVQRAGRRDRRSYATLFIRLPPGLFVVCCKVYDWPRLEAYRSIWASTGRRFLGNPRCDAIAGLYIFARNESHEDLTPYACIIQSIVILMVGYNQPNQVEGCFCSELKRASIIAPVKPRSSTIEMR